MCDHKYGLSSTPNLGVVNARSVEQIKIRSFASGRRPHDPFLPVARPAPPDRNDDPRWRRRRVRRARVEPITLASRRRCASRRLAMARRQLGCLAPAAERSEEHTSELQSLLRISYAVFCLKKKTNTIKQT